MSTGTRTKVEELFFKTSLANCNTMKKKTSVVFGYYRPKDQPTLISLEKQLRLKPQDLQPIKETAQV